MAAASLSAAPGGSVNTSTSDPLTPPAAEFTRFERARILGARALQISLGAPILIEIPPDLVDPVEIAEREFGQSRIPITVRRGAAR